MKNLIKKLGIIAIAIAILTPFVELPTVSAAEEDCETHLQNYMFLDVTSNITKKCTSTGGCIFGRYIEPDSNGNVPGYTTYGLFAYKFADTTNKIVKDVIVDFNDLSDTTALQNYWALHNTVMSYNTATSQNFFEDSKQLGKTFVARNSQNYKTNTIIVHGKWDSENSNNEFSQLTNWSNDINYSTSIQNLGIKNTNDKNRIKVTIDGATYNGTTFGTNSSVSWSNQFPGDYFKKMLQGENEAGIYTDENGYKYIPLKINRKFTSDALDGITFGHKIEEKYYVFSTADTETVNNAVNSYAAFKDFKNAEAANAANEITEEEFNAKFNEVVHEITKTDYDNNINIKIGEPIYWPFVMNVEYKLCSNITEEWSIKYDDNVDDTSVNNMPEPMSVKEKVGTNIKLSTTKPTRKDYTFIKWCDNQKGSGSCYNPGDTVNSPDAAKTVTLYAQWGKTDTEENKKTGVISYIIGFAAVGLVAGGIYLISKKKNLFKQI